MLNELFATYLAYDFLYLVPTVHGHQYGSLVKRVGRDTLQRLAVGEEVQGGVYPVQPPEGLYNVLPSLDPAPLPDVALVQHLGEIQAHLVMERNRLYFARSRLDTNVEEEVTLLRRYESDTLTRSQELLKDFSQLQTRALSYNDTGPAQQEWLTLWEQGATFVQSLADFSDVTVNYTPQPAAQQSAIDHLFARYMNRRYLES
jgi:hypothetical protein